MLQSVGGIIFFNNNYLLQLRDNKKNIYFPGFWGVFGGLVEKREKFKKATEREIKEETNLTVKVSKMIISINYIALGSKQIKKRVYYECKIMGKKKIILKEGKKYKFFSHNQIKKLNIVPLDHAAINYHYLSIIKKTKYLK